MQSEQNNKPGTDNLDWIETATALARSLGMNPTRVRWKLMRLQDRISRWRNRLAGRVGQLNYEHRMCASCGSIQDRANRVCDQCGQKLLPPAIERIARIKYLAPEFVTPTSLLITFILIGYYLSSTVSGGDLMAPSSIGLLEYGANFPPYIFAGEWWRLATCIFLHADVMHILFNLVALQQIGPEVEHIFGKGRMLFYFMITGSLASLGSAYWRTGGVGIGASGALMGLVGLAAGWGQRTGGNAGLMARNLMVQWGVYTIIFGVVVGADNAAHIAGLASGFVIGFFARPAEDRRRSQTLGALQSGVGILLFVATTILLVWHPRTQASLELFDTVQATINKVELVDCGVYSERDLAPLKLNQPNANNDCGMIAAEVGTHLGVRITVSGSPPHGLANFTVRMTHPVIVNPESGEVTTVDEWEVDLPLDSPQFVGWIFEEPWELVGGSWTLQILKNSPAPADKPKGMASQDLVVEAHFTF